MRLAGSVSVRAIEPCQWCYVARSTVFERLENVSLPDWQEAVLDRYGCPSDDLSGYVDALRVR